MPSDTRLAQASFMGAFSVELGTDPSPIFQEDSASLGLIKHQSYQPLHGHILADQLSNCPGRPVCARLVTYSISFERPMAGQLF